MATFKIKPILGSLGDQETQWWTAEDWAEHEKYVEKLKSEGKYLTEGEEITFHMKDYEGFKPEEKTESPFSNFGMLVPAGIGVPAQFIPYIEPGDEKEIDKLKNK